MEGVAGGVKKRISWREMRAGSKGLASVGILATKMERVSQGLLESRRERDRVLAGA